MTQIFLNYLPSKRCRILVLIALLYTAQSQMAAQNCNPDTLPPVAVCVNHLVAAIGDDDPNDCYGPAGPNNVPAALDPKKGAGVVWVKATAFNNGSYDLCGNNVKVTVMRLAPYSDFILNLNTTRGHAPCNDLFPTFPSEFERAISEQDSIKFYAGEIGTTQTVILRVYKMNANGTFAINPVTDRPIYTDCLTEVELEDKMKPVCGAPADVTVSCEIFDPTLNYFGPANSTDNVCLDTTYTTVNYSQFDTLCNRGTLVRNFQAVDCAGNSSTCSQRIVVNYNQNYYVKFPNDLILTNFGTTGQYGEPTFFGEDCELLGVSYEDVVLTNDPDALFRLERTWTIINWCTFDPGLPRITVPNPNPNAIALSPTNLPGPIVSPVVNTGDPWKATISKLTPSDPIPTNFSVYWDANVNAYQYTQIVRVNDGFFVGVQGKVFSDTSANCTYDTGEAALAQWEVKATGLTTGDEKIVLTDVNGNYAVVMNGIDTVVEITLVSSGNLGQNCPTTFTVNGAVGQIVNQDIPVHLEHRCSLLSVGISAPSLRRCFTNRYTAEACNLSGATVADASVEVDLDDYLSYASSSIPGTLLSGNKYRFDVGDLEAGECKRFWVEVNLSCAAPLGYTHCTEAKIAPYDDCRGNSSWTGADVHVAALCDGDSVRMVIKNIGDGAMSTIRDFVVVEDIIMRQAGTFQLGVGDSLKLAYPANGSTWRLEAEQEPLHPFGGVEATALEGCGGLNHTGLVTLFPLSDANPFLSKDCQQNIGSFDPNDKQAFPTGYGAEHFLKQNTDIEYMIRFQNTGTDTAFTVKVLDTLSQYLSPASVRILTSSHPMEFTILEGGVLQFLFNNIALPDSNVNTPASNGFLKFRVAQVPDVQEGTRIENNAAIYFDFNDPVITNTTFHTISNHLLSVGINDPFNAGKGVKVFPNPAEDVAIFKFDNMINEGRFELKNQLGQPVRNERFSGIQYRFERAALQSGVYFFNIHADNGAIFTGKILVR